MHVPCQSALGVAAVFENEFGYKTAAEARGRGKEETAQPVCVHTTTPPDCTECCWGAARLHLLSHFRPYIIGF